MHRPTVVSYEAFSHERGTPVVVVDFEKTGGPTTVLVEGNKEEEGTKRSLEEPATGVPRVSLMCPGLGLQICRARNSGSKTAKNFPWRRRTGNVSARGFNRHHKAVMCKFDSAPSPTT